MSMDYTSYTLRLASFITTNPDNIDYAPLIPATIDYAEQRIYRELNLISTRIANSSSNLTANSRSFTLPTNLGTFITVTGMNVITPVGSTTANGKRNQLVSRSRMFVDYIADYETASAATVIPTMYYMRDQATVIVGPSPGAAFKIEVIGTIRPTPLSYSNPTTFLTTYLPDLFVAGSMVYFSKAIADKNCGAEQSTEYWEKEYQLLVASANSEETRKRYNEEVNKQ